MINNSLYILFSYELLKSEIEESDFVQYLEKTLIDYNKLNLNRKEYTAEEFADKLYCTFLSDIAYKGVINWNDDFYDNSQIEKLKEIRLYFNNDSLFIKSFSQFLSTKNKHQMMEFLANETKKYINAPKIYVFTPINSVQIKKHVLRELRNLDMNTCPIFKLDTSLIGGIRILFDENLFDSSWKSKIESKLLINQ